MLPFLILLILLFAIGGHFLLGALGVTLVLTAGLWVAIIASIVIFCVAIVLFFVFTGIGMLIVGGFSLIWVILALVLFPVLLPILLPLLVVLAFIGMIRKKQAKKAQCEHHHHD
jgi:hypothetical protein